MRIDSAVSAIADFLWDVLTSDPEARDRFVDDPKGTLADAGIDNVTSDELEAAIDRLSTRLPEGGVERMNSLRNACLPDFASQPQTLSQVAPAMAQAVAAPPQFITRVVNETKVIREQPVVNNNVNNHVTNQQQINNNQTYVKEGDTVSNVDNRTITEINARGDVDFDQVVTNNTTVAGRGGVAVNGDLKDSAVNTGKNTGVIAGDDANLEDSVVGNGNTQVNDSEVGAMSRNGDATNIEGQNVNTGSGILNDVNTKGGDAQVVNGHGNDLTGDVDVNASNSSGPTNLTVGDDNTSGALQNGSTNVDDSLNTDKSVSDSGNTSAEDSFNKTVTDNDTMSKSADGSFNDTTTTNDTTEVGLQVDHTDNSFTSDNDSLTSTSAFVDADVDVLGSENDVDLDFDDTI
ncbi:MAG: hypothetical protein ACKV2O_11370 [Acidimicrobiales bacterium]